MSHLPPPQDDVGQAATSTVSPMGVQDSGGLARRLGGVLVSGLTRLLGRVQIDGASGNVVTTTTEGTKEQLDSAAVLYDTNGRPGGGLVDIAGVRSVNTVFGDAVVGQRQGQVVANFSHGLPSEVFVRTEFWDLSSVVGVFTVGEMVMGGTSGATAYIDVITTPGQFQSVEGQLVDGETITGQASGATATINLGSNGFTEAVDSNLIVHSGTLATNEHFIRSRTMSPYVAGFGTLGAWTVAWPDGSAVGTDLWLGLLSEDDGYAMGFQGDTWGILHRRGGVDTFIPAASFSIDSLDGSGPSVFTIDTTKLNAFVVQYGYLGIVGAVFCLVAPDMALIPFHKETRINVSTETIMKDPQVPIAAHIVRTSGTSNFRIFSGSWAAGSVGPPTVRRRKFTASASASVTTAELSVLSIRNKRAHHGQQGRAPTRLISIYVSNIGGTSSTLRIRRNATFVAGVPSYVDVDVLNSVSEVDITSSLTLVSGKIDQEIPVAPDSAQRFQVRIDDLELRPGDSYTFSAQKGPGVGPVLTVSIRWEEDL